MKAALRRLGNTRPDPLSISGATQALNILIRKKDAQGRWFWAVSNTESTLTLIASQRSYAAGVGASLIPTNVVKLENVQLLNSTSYDPPMQILSKSNSLSTWNREGTGTPYQCYLEKGTLPTANKLHFFPTPNAALTVKFNYRRSIAEFDAATDNPDVPQFAQECLISLLAYRLAPEYGTGGETYAILKTEANESWSEMTAMNAETFDSTPARTEYF